MLRTFGFAIAILLSLPLATFAHKVWLLPSQTVLSGADPLVTVDAAVSNDLFYFNHFPLRLDNLVVTAPDGTKVQAENQATLRYRSVFDVPLKQEGTYRIAVLNHGLFGSWEENGERRRWRGTPESFAKEVPKDTKGLQVSESVGRVETFVTNGAPTEKGFAPTGKGLELIPVTHPNDLYAGEKGTFRFLVDGKPAAGLTVEIICGGTRYRDNQEEMHVTTDENGEFTVTWPSAGMYWLETSTSDDKTSISQAQNRRLSYAATLEVLPQ
ncbi:DUF4198 domain-containing protein [Blastopirellula marina]|uniref:DUF4198 domain-containing protein n=1 Tax=Blastopirellula marina TaxID=124 RepID=A0A2S8G232_9BACT|nr:DUF4198 domain-containing protein [Blastopirellula marina]PQO38483.1 DUF4198 domain-containing protein [Blastopirellula marina]PTL45140.1 DUF4198 domain-containing protein [Blastopirellula marina]